MEEETTYRYPWARSLFLVVLYVAFLLFLWYLPWDGPRLFFQKLIMGFLYGLAALLLIGITLVLIVSIIPPVPKHLLEERLGELDENTWDDIAKGRGYVEVWESHAIAVPALLDPLKAELVWKVLNTVALVTDAVATISVDEETGIIAVAEEEDDEGQAVKLLQDVKKELKLAHFSIHKPKF